MKKYLLIYISILALIISCRNKEKNYISLVNAPRSKEPIADYEKIFKPEEREILIKKIKRIEEIYGIKIRILTLPSFFYFEPVGSNGYAEREFSIFGLTPQSSDDVLLFEFSKKEKRFVKGLGKKIDEKRIEQISLLLYKYFNKHKYYTAFKRMIDEIEKELQRNTI